MITAIRNKKRQQAVVIFPAPFSFFTNADIAVNGGIEFSELLNSEENLCMGRAVQSNVSVTLINSDKLLSSVDFMQEFTVALGVEMADGETAVRSGATLAVKVGDHVITASPDWTQVYFDSTAYNISGTAAALFVYEDTLFVIGETGSVINAFTIGDSTLAAATLPEWNAFMLGKAAKWAANGTCLSYVDGVMQECAVSSGVMAYKTSQFSPLGHFVGSKPDKVKTQIVSLSGDDLMQRFEVPAYEYFDTLTYPATLGTLFNKLCEYCEVEVGDVSAALNMDKSFDVAPIDNDTSTCREVLAYIAEAAGCYARISRDGKCELVWFADVDYTLNKTDYFSIDTAEYTVQQIDKLQSHVTQDDIGVIVGEGTNCYDILDNPYLNGASDAEIRPWVTNIYNRLAAFSEYSPITVNCESCWLLRCGDIITVETDEGSKQLPIFAQTISWAGNARASLQSTGEQTRGVMTATNREKLVNGRHYTEISKSVEGLKVEVGKRALQSEVDGLAEYVADEVARLDVEAGKISAQVSEMSIGDRNLLLDSGTEITNADYMIAVYKPSSPLEAGKEYTLVMSVTPAAGVTGFCAFLSDGYRRQGDIYSVNETEKQLVTFTFTASYHEGAEPHVQESYGWLRIYRLPNNGTVTGATTIHWIKVVEGNKATNAYSPPPEEFHNTAVDITPEGVAINTTGTISATVDEEVKLLIDENGVKAPLVRTNELRLLPDNVVIAKNVGSTAEWKGSIQMSLDALPKYLTQDTTLTVPAGTYAEDVVIKGFVGSSLTVKLSAGVTINGTVTMSNCTDVSLFSDSLGNAFIYPRSAGYTVIGIYNCQAALLRGLYISGYRGRTASVAGSTIGVEVYCSNARIYYDCIEYTSSYAYYQDRGTFYMENVIGGCDGSDAATNANLGWGVRAFKGAHGAIYGRCPLSVNGYGASVATLVTTSAAPTAGGMTYTAPEYVTKSFALSKHCTYLRGVKRIRDDQSTSFSQGYYGTYTAGTNNWRIGAMWFADAVTELAGKTIKSATLKIRRGTGGWSSAVGVYLGTVALTESNFTSTLSPTFTKADTYPIGMLKRDTEATYDVTALMSAIQSGYALGVYEPNSSYDGSYSPAYTTFYGLGSGYEPVLTVEYK